MRNKKQDTSPPPAEKTDLDKRVEDLMGPPPDEDGTAPASAPAPKPAEPPAAPTSAPLIPTEALPKEITQDSSTPAPAPAPAAEPKQPAAQPPATEPEPAPKPAAKAEAPEEPDDPDITQAVDDIVAKESDEVLAAEDAALEHAFTPEPAKRSFGQRIKAFFGAWWGNPYARWITIVALVGGLIAAGLIPHSRYFVLNTVGVRSRASITVTDGGTTQPLKNVTIRLAGQSATTDANGKANFARLKLGQTQLIVERRAFAPVTKQVTLGWGSNPLGSVPLTPTGSQYTFELTDFLSGKPVTKATASSANADAVADAGGKIVLTVEPDNDDKELQVTLEADTYRSETLTINLDDKNTQRIKMAPARKHVFVSKRSGKFDVYSIDADAKNEALLLAGTGRERDDIVLAPHATGNLVALVSTRENIRNKDGYLLSSLTILDTKTKDKIDLGQSEQIQIIDWLGDRLVYVQIAAGASAMNAKRQRLMVYDYKNEEKKELAASNSFNDVLAVNGQVFYAPSAYQQPDGAFYRINPDGTNRQTVIGKETWNVFRTQYDKLSLSVGQEWYEYKIGDLTAGKVSGPPAQLRSRLYRDSPDKAHSLWVEERDGKGVLLQYNITGDKKDKVLRTQSGLKGPAFWLNNKYVIYRIQTEQETADYVMNLDGGDPRKLRDVTDSGGIDRWYYYQ